MQTQYNSRAIMVVGMTILGAVGALFVGRAVAIGDFKVIVMVVAVSIAMTIGLALGKNYWLLIPLTFSASGSIGALPVPFSYAELGIIGAFGLFVAHACFKQESLGFKGGFVDILILINMGWLLSLYLRNPVGFQSMGSDMVGGRPYFSILFTFVGYIVLSHGRLKEKWAYWFPGIIAFFMLVPASLVAATEVFPALTLVVYPFYSGVSIEALRVGTQANDVNALRITGLQEVARPIMLALCAYFPPVTLVNPLHLGRFGAFLTGMLIAGLSGFRSLFLAIAGYMAISTVVRRRFADLWALAFAGVAFILIILMAQIGGAPVPLSLQRALAFLPIGWDPAAVRGAEATSEWRMSMWKDAWEDDKIIKNKLLGDGFGYSMEDMLLFSDELLGIGGYIGTGNTYESFMVRGSFHNGPLSAIRFGGFIGFVLAAILMFATFAYCLKTLRRTSGTPFFVLTLFISLPALYEPFQFFVIIGSYETVFHLTLFTVGMMNMINFSLDRQHSESKSLPVQADTSPSIATPASRSPVLSRFGRPSA